MREAAADRLFVALDVDSLAAAAALLEQLEGVVSGVKVGAQLFTAAGPAAVEAVRKRGLRVFLDLKYHDIPNTVAGAVREGTRLGVFMLNVHASGGVAMMRAAAEAVTKASAELALARPIVLGVTVLTSLDRATLASDVGVPGTVDAHVLRLAERARAAGLDGCVASPQEIRLLRNALGPSFVIVTPAIRAREPKDDQTRVATAAWAIAAGASYVVVGRPITGAPDPSAAAAAILDEIRPVLR